MAAQGSANLNDQLDVALEDSDLLAEVELTTSLIIAATESDDDLSQDEVDAVLGVVTIPAQPRRETTSA